MVHICGESEQAWKTAVILQGGAVEMALRCQDLSKCALKN